MFVRLLLIFITVPLVELALLVQLWQRFGRLETIILVMLTGFVGVNLARAQGLQTWRAIHLQMAKGVTPSREILGGVMILVAGAFLITPGVLTDIVGFALLIPLVREWIGVRAFQWFKGKTISTFQTQWANSMDAPVHEFDAASADDRPEVRVVEPDSTSHSSARRS